MSDNPFGDAMEAEESSASDGDSDSDFDMDEYYDALNGEEAPKSATVGVAVSEEMHRFYKELRASDEVDVDPADSIRDHLENLAHRHPEVFEKAMKKLEIDRSA